MVVCFMAVLDADQSPSHSPSWDDLIKSYDKTNYKFVSKYGRRMAEKILEYRMETEFKTEANRIGVNWEQAPPDQRQLVETQLSDCALYTIATADSK